VLGEVGDRHGAGVALARLAAIHLDLGDAPAALATGRRALDLAADLGDARDQAVSLHVMGRACQSEIGIRRDLADHRGRRQALERLAEACAALGDRDAAADCRRRVRAIDQWLASEESAAAV
jgi:tetratricopeptide (TPR) repeat protein